MPDFASLLGLFSLLGLPEPTSRFLVSDLSSVYVLRVAGTPPVYAADTVPRAEFALDWSRTTASVSYAPRLLVADLTGPGEPRLVAFHTANARVEHSGERYMLWVSETLGLGEQYTPILAAPTAPPTTNPDAPIQPAPTVPISPSVSVRPAADVLHLRTTDTTVGWTQRWTARQTTTATAGYTLRGGYGERSEALLPRMHMVSLGLSHGVTLRPTQELATIFTGQRSWASNSVDSWFATALETLSTQWSDATSTQIGAGLSYRQSSFPDGTSEKALLPSLFAAVAYLSRVESAAVNFRLASSVAPWVNPLTGTVLTVANAVFAVSTQWRETGVVASGDITQSLPQDAANATRAVGGGVQALQGLTSWLSATAGVRVQKQYVQASSLGLPLQWVATVGLGITAPTLTF